MPNIWGDKDMHMKTKQQLIQDIKLYKATLKFTWSAIVFALVIGQIAIWG